MQMLALARHGQSFPHLGGGYERRHEMLVGWRGCRVVARRQQEQRDGGDLLTIGSLRSQTSGKQQLDSRDPAGIVIMVFP